MDKRIIVPDRILTIEGFFSPEECREAIEHGEGLGFEEASVQTKSGAQMMPGIRNNTRVTLDNEGWASRMWERLQPFVPSPLFGRDAVGLNERLRFYRYDVGQAFKPHADGSLKRPNGEKSQVTFMVYLNDDFEGGHTRFTFATV